MLQELRLSLSLKTGSQGKKKMQPRLKKLKVNWVGVFKVVLWFSGPLIDM